MTSHIGGLPLVGQCLIAVFVYCFLFVYQVVFSFIKAKVLPDLASSFFCILNYIWFISHHEMLTQTIYTTETVLSFTLALLVFKMLGVRMRDRICSLFPCWSNMHQDMIRWWWWNCSFWSHMMAICFSKLRIFEGKDMEHNIDGFRSTIDIESRQNILSKSGTLNYFCGVATVLSIYHYWY